MEIWCIDSLLLLLVVCIHLDLLYYAEYKYVSISANIELWCCNCRTMCPD